MISFPLSLCVLLPNSTIRYITNRSPSPFQILVTHERHCLDLPQSRIQYLLLAQIQFVQSSRLAFSVFNPEISDPVAAGQFRTMNNTTIAVSLDTQISSLHEHMQCFALPYGGIGFVMHNLANWALFYLVCDESPWRNEPIKHAKINFYFAFLGVLGGPGIAIYNAIRCKDYWPLILVSLWKGAFALTTNAASMVSSWALIKNHENDDAIYGIFLYPLTIVIGLAGLGVVMEQGWGDYRMKIVCSIGIVAFVAVMVGMRAFIGRELPGDLAQECVEWTGGLLTSFWVIGGMLFDWVLAVAANNLSGVPRGGDFDVIATYAFYIVATLIPLGNA
ncbi:hypothetical protein K469DRAFT_717395 [Zopfia rhizophila CBS 207.26]|uniref:Uncharacterized protein n=1 Tax=Zopfia rhizophila CBS 207.26 TaxID=1314779 RepID=A0A6A6ERT9_9PEZI|nr:hypothetical protein K469DRAFT_717395 [Zopfia rhizophila CBS 207.26]